MLNGIDILVTSIPNLLQLINNPLGVFDAKRLKRVVFDEMDSMYQRFGEQTVHKVYSSLFNPAADKQVGHVNFGSCDVMQGSISIFVPFSLF